MIRLLLLTHFHWYIPTNLFTDASGVVKVVPSSLGIAHGTVRDYWVLIEWSVGLSKIMTYIEYVLIILKKYDYDTSQIILLASLI